MALKMKAVTQTAACPLLNHFSKSCCSAPLNSTSSTNAAATPTMATLMSKSSRLLLARNVSVTAFADSSISLNFASRPDNASGNIIPAFHCAMTDAAGSVTRNMTNVRNSISFILLSLVSLSAYSGLWLLSLNTKYAGRNITNVSCKRMESLSTQRFSV